MKLNELLEVITDEEDVAVKIIKEKEDDYVVSYLHNENCDWSVTGDSCFFKKDELLDIYPMVCEVADVLEIIPISPESDNIARLVISVKVD